MVYNGQVLRSNRRSLSIEVKPDMSLLIRAPYWLDSKSIEDYVKQKQDWIVKHLNKMMASATDPAPDRLSDEEIIELAEKSRDVVNEKLHHFAPIVGVEYNNVTIRCQKTRWGSCSGKKNLNFNCLLMLTPEDVKDYVIVHELCHLKELNHSKAFWSEVERVLPEYKAPRRWLKENGDKIMKRAHY